MEEGEPGEQSPDGLPRKPSPGLEPVTRRAPVPAPLRAPLTLYWRDGCHLCEDLEQTLAELVDASRYQLTRVDIDQDEALRQRYNADVPVLCLHDEELCRHFLDLTAVEAALASYNTQDTHHPGG